jgi:hypothetical protein
MQNDCCACDDLKENVYYTFAGMNYMPVYLNLFLELGGFEEPIERFNLVVAIGMMSRRAVKASSPSESKVSLAPASSWKRAMRSPSSMVCSAQLTRMASAPASAMPSMLAALTSRATYCASARRCTLSCR